MTEIDRETLLYIHESEIKKNKINQFIGVLHGVIADGEVLSGEVAYLAEWLKKNKEIAHKYPMNAVLLAIEEAMADGYLSPDELDDIKQLIERIVPPLRASNNRADIPLAPWDEEDIVSLKGNSFCLTGDFISGSRKSIISQTEKAGGIYHKVITKKTSYLFVGFEGSEMYSFGHFGTKIQKAIELRPNTGIKILTEEVWLTSLQSPTL